MRLIDADALNLEYEVDMADDWKTAHEIANIVKYAPTIDAEPVRHGKWIWNDKCKRVCSVCENPVAFMLSKDGWHEGRYCPNCGARMRAD